MPPHIYIHATNVHSGGGGMLLNALVQASTGTPNLTLLVDSRFTLNRALPPHVRPVNPNIFHRLKAEWWLASHVRPGDRVLCFGNLPPLFPLKGRVSLFLQNRYLIGKTPLAGFPLKNRLRIMLERLWFSCMLGHVNSFIVQTPSMKTQLETHTALPVRILPFVQDAAGYARALAPSTQPTGHIFLYVSSGEPHKNHRALIEAWRLLAAENLFPELQLTVDKNHFPSLCGFIDRMKNAHNLKITNHGGMPHQDILPLYRRATACIYPSTLESLGLPLIEARQAGLPILAAETDFIRDVIDPEQTFDAASPLSIARAVKRFMGIKTAPLPLLNAGEFLHRVFEGQP